ncbi:MAG: phenylalanine--tRNA ligase subunit alpha [Candidatus Actinomarina sp.]|tara:strand:+ start:754 stop:1746 length:993 start_codon:yes stop_codon:yes gene_type:complete
MPEVNTDKIFASFLLSIEQVASIDDFNDLEKEYLGKNSLISEERKKLSSMSEISRKKYGKVIQELSIKITDKLEEEKLNFQSKFFKEKELSDNKDITIDWYKNLGSKEHILSSVMNEVVDIFSSIGYTVATGPEAETSWHNFDALNTPDWHPARYESDTLYLDENLEHLLRTQTSTVQVRHMQSNKPPVYIVAPGRVYRSDQLDATHSPVFHQIEGLAVDENLTFSDLKGTLEYFVKEFFGNDIKTKFIPHFFPFTEPSAEVLVSWKDGEWLEILGCGMVDPNVFEHVGYEQGSQGFAFGVGVERLAMIRYKIDHIKNFYENDLRFLRQF